MDMQLEEGEVSDSNEEDGINPYQPLERPILYFEAYKDNHGNGIPSKEEDEASSNIKQPPLLNSDSDTDEEKYSKKIKLSSPVKRKYNNIWNKDPNGDLTDFLNQVGMDEKPAIELSRNVENYPIPFQLNFKEYSDSVLQQKKRKRPTKKKIMDKGPTKLKSKEKCNYVKKIARNLDTLEVNESNTIEEVAEDITKKLKESNGELILRAVIVLGKNKAIQLYEKTKVIEELGGMPIISGTRRRTSGGVFIFLVRNDKDLGEDKIKAIIESDLPQQRKFRNAINKIKKKWKKKNIKKIIHKDNSFELSNPPPSPVLPGGSSEKDVLTEFANLDQQKDMSEFQMDKDEEEGKEEDIFCEDMNFPELV